MDNTQPVPEVENQKVNYKIVFSLLKQFGLFPLLASTIVLFLYILLAIHLVKFSRNYFVKKTKTVTLSPTPFPPPVISPTPIPAVDETANWKIYQNLRYKYQFRYPNDFKLVEESADKVYTSNNLPPDPNCKGGGCNLEIPRLTIFFEHLDNPGEDAMILDEYANSRRESLMLIAGDQGEIKKIQKFGFNVRFMDGPTEGYNHNYFMKPNPDLSFSIIVNFPSKEDVPKYENISDQILSTFKFLDENQPPLGDAITKEECLTKGGVWQKWGMLGKEYCQIPAQDAGKSCTNGSQCDLGKCISISGKLPGECQQFKNIFGCFSFVENGQTSETLCVD